MNVNDKAPEFTLPDQNGEDVSLKQFRGKYVVLYFYPRADTPGCTIEACEFRDSYKKMQKSGAILLEFRPIPQKPKINLRKSSACPLPCWAMLTRKWPMPMAWSKRRTCTERK